MAWLYLALGFIFSYMLLLNLLRGVGSAKGLAWRIGSWHWIDVFFKQGRRAEVRVYVKVMCERLLKEELEAPIRNTLLIALSIASACGGTFIAQSAIGFLIGLSACWLVLFALAAAYKKQVRESELQALPAFYRSLGVSLTGGKSLLQAFEYVAQTCSKSIQSQVKVCVLQMRLGIAYEQCFRELASSFNTSGMTLFVSALLISKRTGSPLFSLFEQIASLSEKRMAFEKELRVKTAQVRLSIKIVSLLPVVIVALLSLISKEFQQGVMSAVGMACLLVAALLIACALLIIRSMTEKVLP